MPGSLIKLQEFTVTSQVATVTIGGSDWDNSYNVYMLTLDNVNCVDDNKDMRIQLKNGSTTLTNYNRASLDLRADTAFSTNAVENATRFDINNATGNLGTETGQAVFYLYNFNNSGYSYISYETNYLTYTGGMIGQQGGGIVKTASVCDTMVFYWESAANFNRGRFALYGLTS